MLGTLIYENVEDALKSRWKCPKQNKKRKKGRKKDRKKKVRTWYFYLKIQKKKEKESRTPQLKSQ